MSSKQLIIEVNNLKKSYRSGDSFFEALRGISFQVAAGELLALIGPSGSGKSTTMDILGLLSRPTEGEYLLDGQRVNEIARDQQAILRNQYIGFIFQSFFLLPRLSAIENVMLPLAYRGVPRKKQQQAAQAILERVGMGSFAKNKPTQLSGGQQQRVAIARALVGEPSMILADEPTGALDTTTSQVVMDLLKELNREKGTSILIVTHDPGVAEQCQRRLSIRDGLLVQEAAV